MISFSSVPDTGNEIDLMPVQKKRTVPDTGNIDLVSPVQRTYDIQAIIRQDSKSPNTARVELRTDIETDEMIKDLMDGWLLSRSQVIRVAVRLMHKVSETES